MKLRSMRWAGYVACIEKTRKSYKSLARNPEGKRPIGRPSRRHEDNIKMDLDLKEIE
jgi:hypothetical protein